MKRVAVGMVVGALAFGAGFAGAKVENVTNPMRDDLNAAGFNVNDAGTVTAHWLVSDNGLFIGARSNLVVTGGPLDPSTGGAVAPVDVGSIYVSPTGLWRKTGPGSLDWACIAGCQ